MKHIGGLSITLIAAYLGLWCFLIIASFLKWIEPVWWGGKALLVVFASSIYVPVSASILYFMTVMFFRANRGLSEKLSYRHMGASGFFLGFFFNPCMFITIHVIGMIPAWRRLNPLIAVHLGFATTSLLCAVISFSLLYVTSLRRRVRGKDKSVV